MTLPPTSAPTSVGESKGKTDPSFDFEAIAMKNTKDEKGPVIVGLGFCATLAIMSVVAHFVAVAGAVAVSVISFLHNCCPTGKCPPILPVGKFRLRTFSRATAATSAAPSQPPVSPRTNSRTPDRPRSPSLSLHLPRLLVTAGGAGAAACIALALQFGLVLLWLVGPGAYFTNEGWTAGAAYYTALCALAIDVICACAYSWRLEMRFRTCCAGRDHCCAQC